MAFHPQHWEDFADTENLKELLNRPNVTLQFLDGLYNTPGLAKSVVLAQFTGLYQISRCAPTNFDTNFLNIASGTFAKRNKSCGMYELMLYFSRYLTDFKGTYKDFDIADIMQAYSSKFITWYHNVMRINEPQHEQEEQPQENSYHVLLDWLERRAQRGEDLTKCGLYQGNSEETKRLQKYIDGLMEKQHKDSREPF